MSTIAFHDLSVFIGTTRIPVREVTAKYSQDMDLVYVNDTEPIGISEGVMRYEGSIKVLLKHALKLEATAPDKKITRLSFDMIKVIKTDEGFVTKVFKKVRVTAFEFSGTNQDQNLEVSLPIIFMGIKTS